MSYNPLKYTDPSGYVEHIEIAPPPPPPSEQMSWSIPVFSPQGKFMYIAIFGNGSEYNKNDSRTTVIQVGTQSRTGTNTVSNSSGIPMYEEAEVLEKTFNFIQGRGYRSTYEALAEKYRELLAECETIHGIGNCSEHGLNKEALPLLSDFTGGALGAGSVSTAIESAAARGLGATTTIRSIPKRALKDIPEKLPKSTSIEDGDYLINQSVTKGAGKEIGILRDAAKGKGNFGLGSATRAEADKLGKTWVGDGYEVASDGKTLVSKDGLKQYRPPSYKPRLGKTQANFEQRFPDPKSN